VSNSDRWSGKVEKIGSETAPPKYVKKVSNINFWQNLANDKCWPQVSTIKGRCVTNHQKHQCEMNYQRNTCSYLQLQVGSPGRITRCSIEPLKDNRITIFTRVKNKYKCRWNKYILFISKYYLYLFTWLAKSGWTFITWTDSTVVASIHFSIGFG